ncbi:MAG: hypothetical protein FWD05_09715 [Oscillospiraceae bacterium]|nr:hypothetical protein [Oscillospiraceae bacterium]
MEAAKAYFDGIAFIPSSPVNAKKNQTAIVTILDDSDNEEKEKKIKPYTRFIGSLSQESCDEISAALLDTQEVDADGGVKQTTG